MPPGGAGGRGRLRRMTPPGPGSARRAGPSRRDAALRPTDDCRGWGPDGFGSRRRSPDAFWPLGLPGGLVARPGAPRFGLRRGAGGGTTDHATGGRDKAPHEKVRGLVLRLFRRRPTLPGGFPPSTIGAGGLNFRVRDGNGCDSAAMATGNRALSRARPPVGGRPFERSIASTSVSVSKPSAD